jgi:hypothetical protein
MRLLKNRRIPILMTVMLTVLLFPSPCRAESGLGMIDRSFQIESLDEGVYVGSAPRSQADFQRLRRLGVRHIIDIRSFKILASGIESHRAAQWDVSYERIPIGFVPTKRQTIPCILAKLQRPTCGAVFIHCNLGSDRTGLIAALYRVETLGWDPQHAFSVWKSTQFNPRLKDLDRYYWQYVARTAEDSQQSTDQLHVQATQD